MPACRFHCGASRGVSFGRSCAGRTTRWAIWLRGLPVIGRWVHVLSHRLSPSGRRDWVAVRAGRVTGFELLVDPRYDAKYVTGEAEPEVQAALAELVRPGSVVWDVGAHIGFFTLLLSKCVGEDGRVVAFEPDPAAVEALRAAVARNGVGNVEVRAVAVWSRPGWIPFERHSESPLGWHGGVGERGKPVWATTLDEEAARGPLPALLKIDVEGAEEQVLAAGRRLLKESQPTLVCEVHLVRRGGEHLLPRVRELLQDAGYDVHELRRGTSSVHLVATAASS